MNHLREMLEQVMSGDARMHPSVKMEQAFTSTCERAMCFWMGDVEDLSRIEIDNSIVRLPYDTCWFELSALSAKDDQFRPNHRWLFGVLVNRNPGGTEFSAWRRDSIEKKWAYISQAFQPGELGTTSMEGRMGALVNIICGFLTAMNCANVTRVENCPSQALQRARQRRGKRPLFRFWTLHLHNQTSPIFSNGSGSHASPSLHLRRGHFKTINGRRYWLGAHWVGKRENGVVHKDYNGSKLVLEAA